MDDIKTVNLYVAIAIVYCYLSSSLTVESINEIFEITDGNKEVISDHIKALYTIFGDAIKELKNEKVDKSVLKNLVKSIKR